jgi:hypothetical protein
MTCPQCKRTNCRKLHNILAPGRGGLDYWRIECCGICRRAIQCQRDRIQRQREKAYTRQR